MKSSIINYRYVWNQMILQLPTALKYSRTDRPAN